jgi:2-deoxy-D-gluconate 3-dehydrogenase
VGFRKLFEEKSMSTDGLKDPIQFGNEMSAQSIAELVDLRGKVAIVTGAASGIGRSCAIRLSQAGAHVMAADMNRTGITETKDTIVRAGGRAQASAIDVCHKEQTDALVKRTVSDLGRVDILVNAAGIYPPAFALDIQEQAWDSVLATNLRGLFFLTQAAASHMVGARRGGSIVNIASMDAFLPTTGLAHYDASKAGVLGLTQALAKEWGAYGIRVNAVAPGNIYTPGALAAADILLPMFGVTKEAFKPRSLLNRWGQPDDMARVVLFLSSSLSSFVTGSTLLADGGAVLI